ncbi:hypothetical protein [Bradyrhizobium sp. Arg816]|uniref:hypothetical protein n=1 Tax=Bradyrhizobium sp. Arg816 TaxID=2998491 RepID=UPI00249D9249|nr:hypothetical protein [Bradyrhizobium sp. Arg816]MDI3567238.1 hypothetical protein [Bradyrhizobium sp. Arg816]
MIFNNYYKYGILEIRKFALCSTEYSNRHALCSKRQTSQKQAAAGRHGNPGRLGPLTHCAAESTATRRLGRRVRHRRRLYLAELTSPDVALQRTFAADCAELAIAIEDMQGRQLAGENVAEDLVRLRNELRRAESKLQLQTSSAKAVPQSLEDWWHQTSAESGQP